MRIISVINLKGGVAKTITSINMAYIMSQRGYKVLLVDNDKQGNTSKFFGVHSYDAQSMSDILSKVDVGPAAVIASTKYAGLDVIPANMTLLAADRAVLIDTTRVQQTRLKKALASISGEYDFCIIDNAPDLSMSTINALVASDDVIVPLKIDNFALDGLTQLVEQIEYASEFNPGLTVRGCVVTIYQNSRVSSQGLDLLKRSHTIPVFDTLIPKTIKVDESTFSCIPLLLYAPTCSAAVAYDKFVTEYLSKTNVPNLGTNVEV